MANTVQTVLRPHYHPERTTMAGGPFAGARSAAQP